MLEQGFKDTPEFKAAVAEAAATAAKEAARAAVAEFRQELLVNSADKGSDHDDLFRKMALAIAEISDQGSNRKRVAPEILAKREAAKKRCVDLVLECRAKIKEARSNKDAKEESKWTPEYRVIAKCYFNERFIEPYKMGPNRMPVPTEIYWTGVPNMAMVPLNDVAKKIFAEFRLSIDNVEPIPTLDNRPLFMTAAGLVVKGDPPKRKETGAQTNALDAPMFEDEVAVKSLPNDPTAELVHVLGTIAAPARQNYQGSHPV